MAKAPKKMAMGGDAGYRDMAYIEGRDFPVGGNEANNFLGGSAAMVGVKPTPIYPDLSKMQKGNFINTAPRTMTPGYSRTADDGVTEYVGAQPVEDINSLYGSMLGRAPDPTGIAANRGASADTIRQSILASPEYKKRAEGFTVLQKKGGVIKKAAGGTVKKGGDWHGFGGSKTGNNNHGF
jgi:hypothetical protein